MTRYLGLWVLLGLLLPPLGFAQEIEQEIATEVQALSARHFTQCGTDYFSQYINPVAKGTSKRNQALATTITQYQGFERIAKEATLARADELNGVQWRVEVSFQ